MPLDPATRQFLQTQGTIFSGSTGFGPPPMPNLGQLIPGMNGPGGMALSALLYPLLNQFAASQGIVGFQFAGHQNLQDTLQRQIDMQQRNIALSGAAQADQSQLTRMFEGMARVAHGRQDLTNAERGAAQRAARDVSGMLPFLSMVNPMAVDAMFGRRGSQTAMAMFMERGARFMVDPTTGYPGMLGQSRAELTKGLYSQLFEGSRVNEMAGLGAGATGQLFDEMSRRGFLGGPSGAKVGAPMSQNTRESEITRIAGRLRETSKAVGVMRDIFGDEGKMDAPMHELVNGLQALTQGGLSYMSPAKLEQTLSKTRELARGTGVGIAGVMQMNAQAAAVTDRLGLDRSIGVAATQDALSYSMAYGTSRFAGTPGFGRLSKEGMMSLDQQLLLTGAASPMAQQMAAIMHVRDLNAKTLDKNSDFARMAQAIQNHEATFVDKAGNVQSVNMSFDDVRKMADASGMANGGRDFMTALRSPNATQYAVQQYNLGLTARRLQGVDLANMLRRQFTSTNMSDADAERAVAKLMSLSENELRDTGSMVAAVSNSMGGGAETRSRVNQAITQAQQLMGTRGSPWWTMGQGHLNNAIIATSPELERRRTAFDRIFGEKAAFGNAVRGIGQYGMARNLVDYITENGNKATFEGLITNVFGGGVDVAALEKHLASQAGGANARGIFAKMLATNDPNEKEKLMRELGNTFGNVSPEYLAMGRNQAARNDNVLLQRMGAAGITGPEAARRTALSNLDPAKRQLLVDALDFASSGLQGPQDVEHTKSMSDFQKAIETANDQARAVPIKIPADAKVEVTGTLGVKDGKLVLTGYAAPATSRGVST